MGSEILRPNADDAIWVLWSRYPGTGEDYYEDVDEVICDDDATYLYTTVINKSVRLDIEAGSGIGTIASIEVHVVAKEVGSVLLATGYQVAGGSYNTNHSLTSSYVEYSDTYTTNYYTGLAFTWAEIATMQLRISTSSISGEARVTQMWLVVNYSAEYSQAQIIG